MPPVLLAHGIAYGGSFSDPDPTATTVEIDTTGATFILISYAGDALQGELDPVTDSQSNSLTQITSMASPYFPFTTGTAAFYWIGAPIVTSATHSFTATCIAGSGHAVMEVMAWGGLSAPSFTDELWDQSGTGALTLGPVTLAAGISFAIAAIGFGDITDNAPAILGTAGWTVVDTLSVLKFGPGSGYGNCGMTAAYKVFGSSTPAVTNDWTAATTTGHMGAGIFSFAYEAPPPPPEPVTSYIRRQRIIALPAEHNKQMFLSRLELVIQSGMGLSTGLGSDPIIMVQLSRDGGFTYGPELQLHGGKIGEYLKRVYANRLGRGRQLVVKITQTDPVFCAWLDLIVNLTEGTS